MINKNEEIKNRRKNLLNYKQKERIKKILLPLEFYDF